MMLPARDLSNEDSPAQRANRKMIARLRLSLAGTALPSEAARYAAKGFFQPGRREMGGVEQSKRNCAVCDG
jgi:hypothetical protein